MSKALAVAPAARPASFAEGNGTALRRPRAGGRAYAMQSGSAHRWRVLMAKPPGAGGDREVPAASLLCAASPSTRAELSSG